MSALDLGIPTSEWEVARGGRSVNIGRAAGKIRAEAGLPPDQLLAVMQLIAAAPNLFAALEALEAVIGFEVPMEEGETLLSICGDHHRFNEALAIARAAIAKATGKAVA